MRHHLEPGPSGVRVIGHAQEPQRVWVGGDARRDPASGVPHYAFARVERRVSVVYFYFWDSAWRCVLAEGVHLLPVPDEAVVQRS